MLRLPGTSLYHVRIGKQQLAMAPLRRRSKQVLNRRGAVIARCRHTPLEIAGGAEAALAKAALEARRYRDIGSRWRRDPAAPAADDESLQGVFVFRAVRKEPRAREREHEADEAGFQSPIRRGGRGA